MDVLTAYFDDSGTHAGSESVTVAGYLSTTEMWTSFDSAWRGALQRFGLPYFHMRQFAHGVGPYKHWSEPQRRMRIGHLIEIINAHVVTSYGVAIPGDLFDAHFSAKAKAFCGGAYGLAASINFSEVGATLRRIKENGGPDGRVAYVFESGTAGFGQVAKVFQYNEQNAQEKERLHLLSLRVENKREFVALQAADILAYELHLQLPKDRGRNERPPRAIIRDLAKVNRNWIWVDEDTIKSWSHTIEIAADLAGLLGWPRKRGEEMDAQDRQSTLEAIARRAVSRAERQSRRRSKRGR